jgi:hypothetical protein
MATGPLTYRPSPSLTLAAEWARAGLSSQLIRARSRVHTSPGRTGPRRNELSVRESAWNSKRGPGDFDRPCPGDMWAYQGVTTDNCGQVASSLCCRWREDSLCRRRSLCPSSPELWGAFAWVAEASSARLLGPGRPEHGYNGATPRVCSLGPI